jgi:hypothetical protein
MNPNMLAFQQQQLMQRQRQAILQQQMYGGGGMPMNMQNMNAAQFQQMRQNGMQPRIPPHLAQAHLPQGGQHPNPQQQVSNIQPLCAVHCSLLPEFSLLIL